MTASVRTRKKSNGSRAAWSGDSSGQGTVLPRVLCDLIQSGLLSWIHVCNVGIK